MPTLVYHRGGRPNAYVFGAHEAPIIIGRGLDCVIVVKDGDVSRKHAEIFTEDSGATWYVRDLNSANGCFVNGRRVEKSRLSDGDTVSCGTLDFEFRRGDDSSRVVRTRDTGLFRAERTTPLRGAGVVGDRFHVRECIPTPHQISKEALGVAKSSALMKRVQELERENRAVEQENERLRSALTELSKLTGNAPSDARDVETFRAQIMRSVSTMQSATIAAVADVIQLERQHTQLFDKRSTVVHRDDDRERATTDEDG